MSERTSSKPSIADYVVSRRKRKECFLDEIDRLIDWNPLEKLLRKTLKRVVNAIGNPAYPPLPMFKILLLQRWYNLSDVAVEEALYDRFSFVRFVGLSLDHDEVPDATTICRFRQSLVERNVQKRLLDKLNHQLQRRGLLVREGAIVDAIVVSSARRPLKVLDVLAQDRQEDNEAGTDVTISYSDDAEAAWLRKGNRAYYGYKIHAATDALLFFAAGGFAGWRYAQDGVTAEIAQLPELAKWAASKEGKMAYQFAMKGSLKPILYCQGDGWKVKNGLFFP